MSAPTSDDTTRALQTARRYVEVAYNNACMLEYDNQDEAKLLRLIDKGLDTLRRERDAALGVAKGAADILAAAVSENASLKEQLAASERTCAELRGDVNELRLDLAHMTDRHAVASERAEAAERTVEGLRAAPTDEEIANADFRFARHICTYPRDRLAAIKLVLQWFLRDRNTETKATEIGDKKG